MRTLFDKKETYQHLEETVQSIIDVHLQQEDMGDGYIEGYASYKIGLKQTLEFVRIASKIKDRQFVTHYTQWLKILWKHHAVHKINPDVALHYMKHALEQKYKSEENDALVENVEYMLETLEAEHRERNDGYGADRYCSLYVEYLIGYKKQEAFDLVIKLLEEEEMGLEMIYLTVFQPAMEEIGRLWQVKAITVAQEHYSTSATQWIMTKIYPHRLDSEQEVGKKRVFVGATVEGEYHEVGIRMLSELAELEGWETYYLGASTPMYAILKILKEQQVDVLGLSATMYTSIEEMKAVIDKIREDKTLHSVKILVGGYVFNQSEAVWQYVGADGYGKDARESLVLMDKWMS